ncbi:hypothetical protein AKJ56_00320 [candidate division MSBL1 archaeon SCGC-AAA382N08]|uniref:SprT-like domain-containing protein n=1 Tax=candidate division MSBL1 archaeon SCGC-AAA382N08 TaxID=1698285 RepID=A0A133VQP7_9EURY|nr:hypothetical protein AKJ56_00320 [candidate division MSBL1 archaeon SCGC-AAA382N08]
MVYIKDQSQIINGKEYNYKYLYFSYRGSDGKPKNQMLGKLDNKGEAKSKLRKLARKHDIDQSTLERHLEEIESGDIPEKPMRKRKEERSVKNPIDRLSDKEKEELQEDLDSLREYDKEITDKEVRKQAERFSNYDSVRLFSNPDGKDFLILSKKGEQIPVRIVDPEIWKKVLAFYIIKDSETIKKSEPDKVSDYLEGKKLEEYKEIKQKFLEEKGKESSVKKSEGENYSDVKSRFKSAISDVWNLSYGTWNEEPYSKMEITVKKKDPEDIKAKDTYAGVRLSTGRTENASGDSLLQVPLKVKLEITDKFLNMDKEERYKILKHEAIHLGYPKHGKKFREMAKKSGTSVSVARQKGEKIKVKEQKGEKYSKYETVKKFDSFEKADKYAKKLAEETGNKVRVEE